MQYAIKCDSWDKPGKNEVPKSMINWTRVIKNCPDCDRKRSTLCQDPACNRAKNS